MFIIFIIIEFVAATNSFNNKSTETPHKIMNINPNPTGMDLKSSSLYTGHLYVQGQFIYQPGHFCCDAVWRSSVAVHERLRDPSSRKGVSLGLNAIKTVLEGFRVSNRKDMFVYKETLGSVFYFK